MLHNDQPMKLSRQTLWQQSHTDARIVPNSDEYVSPDNGERCRNRLTTRTRPALIARRTDKLTPTQCKQKSEASQTDKILHAYSRATRLATLCPRQPRLASTRAGRQESAHMSLPCAHSHFRKGGAEKGNPARRGAGAAAGCRKAAGVVSALRLFARFRSRREAKVGEYLGPERRGKAESACNAATYGVCQCAFLG